MDAEDIVIAAQKELKDELFRDAVDKEKKRIKNKKTLRQVIFPWKIIIVSLNKKRG